MSMLRTIEELRVNGGKEVVAEPAEGKSERCLQIILETLPLMLELENM